MNKKYSIQSEKEIRRLYREGRHLAEGCLFFKFLANGLNHPRFVISVSRKVSKKAVVRNRLKRIIRAAIRNNPTLLRMSFNAAISVSSKRCSEPPGFSLINRHIGNFSEKLALEI